MKISNVIYGSEEGRPVLNFELEGEPVSILYESLKPSLIERGYVCLGYDWEDRVPEINLPAYPPHGAGPITLRGFTDDPDVLKTAKDFLSALQDNSFSENPNYR